MEREWGPSLYLPNGWFAQPWLDLNLAAHAGLMLEFVEQPVELAKVDRDVRAFAAYWAAADQVASPKCKVVFEPANGSHAHWGKKALAKLKEFGSEAQRVQDLKNTGGHYELIESFVTCLNTANDGPVVGSFNALLCNHEERYQNGCEQGLRDSIWRPHQSDGK